MATDERTWRTTATRTPFENGVLKIRLESIETTDGRRGEWTVIEIADGVAVIPVHPDGSITLISQYRHPTGAWALELPAGRREPGEEPSATARRELIEEAGFSAGRLESLGVITPLNGIARHRVHLFRAFDLKPTATRHETFEDIRVVRLTPGEIRDHVARGAIECGILLAGLYRHAATPSG